MEPIRFEMKAEIWAPVSMDFNPKRKIGSLVRMMFPRKVETNQIRYVSEMVLDSYKNPRQFGFKNIKSQVFQGLWMFASQGNQ